MEQAVATKADQFAATEPDQVAEGHESSQHPIGVYLNVWILLFVLSTFSYLVDYFDLQGFLRWGLIIFFMLLKAGFIVAVFMHLKWERIALISAILAPPAALLVLIGFMVSEGEYVFDKRVDFFGHPEAAERIHVQDVLHGKGEH